MESNADRLRQSPDLNVSLASPEIWMQPITPENLALFLSCTLSRAATFSKKPVIKHPVDKRQEKEKSDEKKRSSKRKEQQTPARNERKPSSSGKKSKYKTPSFLDDLSTSSESDSEPQPSTSKDEPVAKKVKLDAKKEKHVEAKVAKEKTIHIEKTKKAKSTEEEKTKTEKHIHKKEAQVKTKKHHKEEDNVAEKEKHSKKKREREDSPAAKKKDNAKVATDEDDVHAKQETKQEKKSKKRDEKIKEGEDQMQLEQPDVDNETHRIRREEDALINKHRAEIEKEKQKEEEAKLNEEFEFRKDPMNWQYFEVGTLSDVDLRKALKYRKLRSSDYARSSQPTSKSQKHEKNAQKEKIEPREESPASQKPVKHTKKRRVEYPCVVCGRNERISEDFGSQASAFCSLACLDGIVERTKEVLADTQEVTLMADGAVYRDRPKVAELRDFLVQYPKFVPVLPRSTEVKVQKDAEKKAKRAAEVAINGKKDSIPEKQKDEKFDDANIVAALVEQKKTEKAHAVMRISCEKVFSDAMLKRVKRPADYGTSSKRIKELAGEIERALFDRYGGAEKEYKFWANGFTRQLSAARNKGLFARVITGTINVALLLSLTPSDMEKPAYSAELEIEKKEAPAAAKSAEAKIEPQGGNSVLDLLLASDTTLGHGQHMYDNRCRICREKVLRESERTMKEAMKFKQEDDERRKRRSAAAKAKSAGEDRDKTRAVKKEAEDGFGDRSSKTPQRREGKNAQADSAQYSRRKSIELSDSAPLMVSDDDDDYDAGGFSPDESTKALGSPSTFNRIRSPSPSENNSWRAKERRRNDDFKCDTQNANKSRRPSSNENWRVKDDENVVWRGSMTWCDYETSFALLPFSKRPSESAVAARIASSIDAVCLYDKPRAYDNLASIMEKFGQNAFCIYRVIEPVNGHSLENFNDLVTKCLSSNSVLSLKLPSVYSSNVEYISYFLPLSKSESIPDFLTSLDIFPASVKKWSAFIIIATELNRRINSSLRGHSEVKHKDETFNDNYCTRDDVEVNDNNIKLKKNILGERSPMQGPSNNVGECKMLRTFDGDDDEGSHEDESDGDGADFKLPDTFFKDMALSIGKTAPSSSANNSCRDTNPSADVVCLDTSMDRQHVFMMDHWTLADVRTIMYRFVDLALPARELGYLHNLSNAFMAKLKKKQAAEEQAEHAKALVAAKKRREAYEKISKDDATAEAKELSRLASVLVSQQTRNTQHLNGAQPPLQNGDGDAFLNIPLRSRSPPPPPPQAPASFDAEKESSATAVARSVRSTSSIPLPPPAPALESIPIPVGPHPDEQIPKAPSPCSSIEDGMVIDDGSDMNQSSDDEGETLRIVPHPTAPPRPAPPMPTIIPIEPPSSATGINIVPPPPPPPPPAVATSTTFFTPMPPPFPSLHQKTAQNSNSSYAPIGVPPPAFNQSFSFVPPGPPPPPPPQNSEEFSSRDVAHNGRPPLTNEAAPSPSNAPTGAESHAPSTSSDTPSVKNGPKPLMDFVAQEPGIHAQRSEHDVDYMAFKNFEPPVGFRGRGRGRGGYRGGFGGPDTWNGTRGFMRGRPPAQFGPLHYRGSQQLGFHRGAHRGGRGGGSDIFEGGWSMGPSGSFPPSRNNFF